MLEDPVNKEVQEEKKATKVYNAEVNEQHSSSEHFSS